MSSHIRRQNGEEAVSVEKYLYKNQKEGNYENVNNVLNAVVNSTFLNAFVVKKNNLNMELFRAIDPFGVFEIECEQRLKKKFLDAIFWNGVIQLFFFYLLVLDFDLIGINLHTIVLDRFWSSMRQSMHLDTLPLADTYIFLP